jgi:hypothetical protein
LGLNCFFGFLVFYTVGRTPWKGDQPVARPLPTQKQHKHRINTHRHPCLKWDSKPRSQYMSGGRQFMSQTARPLWSAISASFEPKMQILDITVLWDVTPYNPIDRYQRFRNSTFLRNAGNALPDYTASHHRRYVHNYCRVNISRKLFQSYTYAIRNNAVYA